MSNACEFYADALVEHAAGLLDPERTARVESHVAECQACAETLRVIAALKASPTPVPAGLEARIRTAVRGAADAPPTAGLATDTSLAGRPVGPVRRGRAGWKQWAVPLVTAAAVVGLWIGVGMPGVGTPSDDGPALALLDDQDLYGAWPADGLIVAGDPLLSELSIEELEYLLQELES